MNQTAVEEQPQTPKRRQGWKTRRPAGRKRGDGESLTEGCISATGTLQIPSHSPASSGKPSPLLSHIFSSTREFLSPGPEKYHQLPITESLRSDLFPTCFQLWNMTGLNSSHPPPWASLARCVLVPPASQFLSHGFILLQYTELFQWFSGQFFTFLVFSWK